VQKNKEIDQINLLIYLGSELQYLNKGLISENNELKESIKNLQENNAKKQAIIDDESK